MGKKWNRREFFKTSGIMAAGAAFSGIGGKWSLAATALNHSTLRQKAYMGLRGLAKYPYFEMTDKGLLRLTVDGMEGGIDGHTHLALNGFAGGKPDLLKPYPKTHYYLPPDIKTSLYVYANQNANAEEKKAMGRTVMKTYFLGGSDVTDTHTIPNLVAEMDLLGIEKAVMLPVHCGWLFNDNMTERYMMAIQKSGRQDRFILCGSVKPTLKDAAQSVKAYHDKTVRRMIFADNARRFWGIT